MARAAGPDGWKASADRREGEYSARAARKVRRARRPGRSYIAVMAYASHRSFPNDKLPPPATALEIERRVPEHVNAVAGIFSFEDAPMSKLRPRGTLAALAVAMLYVALVLGAPLIVRYGPQPEVAGITVHIALPK